MKYRNLGKHGLKISEISLGTMHYGSYVKKDIALKCLKEAVDQGINYLDSADRYGVFDASGLESNEKIRAESILGDFLKDYNREDFVIGTKVWYKMKEDVITSGGLSRKHIREGIKDSLKHLQTDYVDIYYCHRPDRETPLEETIRVMSNLIDEGYINYWGTSWWPPTLVERTIGIAKNIGAYPPAVEEPPYHMRARFIETDLLEVASYHGLGLITFEALATGLLTGKYFNGEPTLRRKISQQERSDFDEITKQYTELISNLDEIVKELNTSISNLAIAWTLRHPEITSSLTGASKPEHIKMNAEACELSLSENIIKNIDELLNNSPKQYFR